MESFILKSPLYYFQGFCIPPEEECEGDGEGATEFEDIENGGLGEGQGAKDVSDQIESQDQVLVINIVIFSQVLNISV